MSSLAALFLAPLLAAAPSPQGGDAAADGEATAEDTSATETSGGETTEAAEGEPAAGDPASGEGTGGAVTRGELDALKAELSETKERLEAVEEAQLDEMSLEEADEGVQIYGFFDLNFVRFFVDDKSFFEGLVPSSSSFFVQNLNLYFAHDMTDTLSTLAELRFTFQPLGQETSYELAGLTSYERTDTTVGEAYNTQNTYRLGGIAIERVHLTWRPTDWFAVLAGRYLTPYGVWNVEHGSPVIIGVRPPFVQTSAIVPLAQTGLQVFGRFYPAAGHYIDYAITASNGRGPAEAIIDYDEHKGLGGRLRYLYEGQDGSFSLGGYGYWGTYTDQKRVMVLDPEFDMEIETTEDYTEYAITADMVVELHGVRLQGEYARELVEYDKRVERDITLGGTGYQPDHIRYSTYGLLAWTLPLDALLGNMKLTPYFMFEYSDVDDAITDNEAYVLDGGINFRPSPYVVLKADYSYVNQHKQKHADFSVLSLQMAVSF